MLSRDLELSVGASAYHILLTVLDLSLTVLVMSDDINFYNFTHYNTAFRTSTSISSSASFSDRMLCVKVW